ncbi:acetyl-coenzyme A synthetase 2-like, mitochondrial isoform X1 [Hydra vulgaris]|uniref:Acetyl-coenzyme A synthetase n=1 Tax=Hydra vulgaris TaxID=6087 RepID=T2M576_HYDVU|nr:acetyl-coenzyme A synthetase 2-like, mitochondrial [Hydra vulgaris]
MTLIYKKILEVSISALHKKIYNHNLVFPASKNIKFFCGFSKQNNSKCLDVVTSLSQVSEHHSDLYELSLNDPTKFWGEIGRKKLQWINEFHTVTDSDISVGKHGWFLGGKINISENCLDRHVKEDPNRVALIWERDEPGTHVKVTYSELLAMTCQIANALKRRGVQKGDVVCLYMPASPLAVASMLACTRIGAVHSVVFAGFSAEALAARINDASVKTVITADEGLRGGKRIPLKQTVDTALKLCSSVTNVFVAKRSGIELPMQKGRDIFLNEAMAVEKTFCDPEVMDSEDTMFILYTSGSTGKPKGVVHTHAGYLLYAMLTHQLVFDYKPGDIHACVADIGWITGHSYVVYGPLANGATTVLFESVPSYPDPGRYWEMVERLGINQFYGAPTAIRYLLKFGDEYVKKYDRSSLKILGSVGEPINEEAWHWYQDVVGDGKCPVVDTWWQTETGGILLTPLPAPKNSLVKPACPVRPFFGVEPVLLDNKGNVLQGNSVRGMLCIKKSIPGMSRTLYANKERFLEAYYKPFPGYYFTGDEALRDSDGSYHITGRVDDVINVKGIRLGTAEVEDILDNHHSVAETAVVGYPHKMNGEGVYAYVTLKENVTESEDAIKNELRLMVKKAIGGFAVPELIQISPGLPKTRSGKIMRRILRCIAANRINDIGDVSTLAEPEVVDAIVQQHFKLLQTIKS